MKRICALLVVSALAIGVVALTGCGGGGGGTAATPAASPTSTTVTRKTGSAKFTFKIPRRSSRDAGRAAGKIPSNTVSIKISIHGEDMAEPIEQTITDFNETTTATITDIPVGERIFVIAALDANGEIIASSAEIAQINDQQITSLHSELGVTLIDGVGAFPATITLDAGDTLNVKSNFQTQPVALSVPGTGCPPTGLSFGLNSQLACTFTEAGTYTLTGGGQTLATITVAGTASVFKADASSDLGYGQPPVDVTFSGRAASSTSGTYTYSWDFGDGGTSSAQNPTHTFESVGDYMVTLTVSDGANTASDYVNVHVANLPEPEVYSVTPATGANTADTSITIGGEYFQAGATVQIGGSEAIYVEVVSDVEITAVVPAGLSPGAYDLVVTNPDGNAGSLAGGFTVTGTSAAAYTIADYFMLSPGDQWTYIESGFSGSTTTTGGNAEEITMTVSTAQTVNGRTCYYLGESGNGMCFSMETDGLYVHQRTDTHNESGATVTEVVTLDPPMHVTDASVNLGDSFTATATISGTTNGVAFTGSVSATFDILGVESVATLAGYFADCLKVRLTTTQSNGEVSYDTFWMARGVGIVKEKYIEENTSGSSCTGDGCSLVLENAALGTQTYPYSVSPTIFDGTYWAAFLTPGTASLTPSSGYATATVSNGTMVREMTSGNFTTGGSTSTITNTVTALSNGVFSLNSNEAAAIGFYDSSARNLALITKAQNGALRFKVFTKKGASYTESMIQGDYFGVQFSIDTAGVAHTKFMNVTFSNGTMSKTGLQSSSTGTFNAPFTQSFSYTFDPGGVITLTNDSLNPKILVGENGDVILSVTYLAGKRQIGIMTRKGGNASPITLAGPYTGINLGYDLGYPTSPYFGDGFALELNANSFLDVANISMSGGFELHHLPFTMDSTGLIAPSDNPYMYIGANYNGSAGVMADLSEMNIGFILNAMPPSTQLVRPVISRVH